MKILVISDTHRYLKNAEYLIEKFQDKIKLVFHLGDLVSDVVQLQQKYPDVTFHFVRGNNDFEDDIPFEKMVRLGGKKILLTHGHRQRVNYGLMNLQLWAMEQEADMVLFGHTHTPMWVQEGTVSIANPGSLSLPRSTEDPTFGILEIEESGRILFSILCLDNKRKEIYRYRGHNGW